MITLAYEQYVKMIAALITTPSKKRDPNQKHREEEDEVDLMDIEELGSTNDEKSFNQSLAAVYGHGEELQVLSKPYYL